MITKHGLWFFKRLKTGMNFVVTSGDIVVNSGGVSMSGPLSAGGNILIGGHADGRKLLFSDFQCPAPGTDWTPEKTGIGLIYGKTGSKAWLPLNALKLGDEIVGYRLAGYTVGATLSGDTLDCKLARIDEAVPVTASDLASGAIVQVTTSAAFYAAATLNAVATVTSGTQYTLEIAGSTSESGHQVIMGAEVEINRKV